jgi:hypothetical protein
MTTRQCFQTILPVCPGCEALKLVVSERDQGQWAALLIDPAIGQEASEPLADGLDSAKRLAIKRAMVHRRESALLNADEEVGRIEGYFGLLEWRPCQRPKFLRFYGTLELRVEQIAPHEWGGSICSPFPIPGETVQLGYTCDPFTSLTEDAAKHGALATAANKMRGAPMPEGSDPEWRTCSDIADESWSKTHAEHGFRGYPEREGGRERWPGF